jgi:hypothetical protein
VGRLPAAAARLVLTNDQPHHGAAPHDAAHA